MARAGRDLALTETTLVGAQLSPLGTVAEDHREQEPFDLCVDARPPHARVEQRSASLRPCRVVRVEQDRGNADSVLALPDGEARPVLPRMPGQPRPALQGPASQALNPIPDGPYTFTLAP